VVHPEHNFYCSPATLANFLGRHGFEVDGIELYSSVWIPSRKNIEGTRDLAAKTFFFLFDIFVNFPAVRIFPYFAEGMLLKARLR
jgi:hypothetical protein